ncbi:MAG: flagellar biosynthetic protein FliO [Terriglobia bacterium]
MVRMILAAIGNLLTGARGIRCKRKERAMHLCETLSLGDRRFLALVRVEQNKFLVGAAGNAISLLAQLPSVPDRPGAARTVEDDLLFDAEEYKTWQ